MSQKRNKQEGKKEDPCKCGHIRITHLNSGGHGRGKCTSTKTYAIVSGPPPHKLPGYVELLDIHKKEDVNIWNRILGELRPTMRAKVMKRGYAYLECPCPMFHLVDLGQIKLEVP